ncbi:cysteine hydrolase family protein [Gryllotalpicola protaetiae]|uniref:Cysteine hydrolase n=1 Tax=Gryllotalpicola protaetiae TaxID=2419771 RepID=A0A387BJJ7_9MICO|nr:cysteine hydrolase [Gryllotalpicola protaetiae]AYG02422.1 cysteine hydrolase [Gryllotalpicola protaetiae]
MSTDAWLVVVDMQNVFAHDSPWASPDYETASVGIRRLMPAFGNRVVFTRYVAPAEPRGAWVPYFAQWPFALVPAGDPLYAFTPEIEGLAAGRPVVTRESFGKWGLELKAALHGASEIVLTGVSTDCCVLSTALPAADDGVHVLVPTDACAGASAADHQRALDAMALYAPLIELTTVDDLLG